MQLPSRGRGLFYLGSTGMLFLMVIRSRKIIRPLLMAGVSALVVVSTVATAQSPVAPGVGNATAESIAKNSPFASSAYQFVLEQADQLHNEKLRAQTHDALANPDTCIQHRANLTPARKQAIVQELLAAGLLSAKDDAAFPGGLLAGVFPPVRDDGTPCPKLPQPFWSAPGSNFGSHHSYPGGLAVHESNNETSALTLANNYRSVYGQSNEAGAAVVKPQIILHAMTGDVASSGLSIDQDIIIGAPLWHDWAKSIVFQWIADGTEFQELNIGGNGATDNYGQPGASATGAHHILSIAESMKRGFPPAFVIAQASAHSAPTLGNEYKVVNWIRAAAIINGIDPVTKGYLTKDASGHLRLPALRKTGEAALPPEQTSFLAEDTIHNESDSDYTFSAPAVTAIQTVLAQLAPGFGYNPTDTANYNNKFRNVVLSNDGAERLYILYSNLGVEGVRKEVERLKTAGKL